MRRGYRDHPTPALSTTELEALRAVAAGREIPEPPGVTECDIGIPVEVWDTREALLRKHLIYFRSYDQADVLTTLGRRALVQYQNA